MTLAGQNAPGDSFPNCADCRAVVMHQHALVANQVHVFTVDFEVDDRLAAFDGGGGEYTCRAKVCQYVFADGEVGHGEPVLPGFAPEAMVFGADDGLAGAFDGQRLELGGRRVQKCL
jgi:hypothetical protein